ncbi:retron system putative HNH endonuclease [Gordonia humi]
MKNTNSTPWRNTELKEALREETNGKCAYCESVIEDVAPAHVEHILPKSIFPKLVLEWSNLTLCCPTCNANKKDYYSTEVSLLNPYVDDPSNHLMFLGAFVWSIPSSLRGHKTIETIELNRPKLLEERENFIQSLHDLLTAWSNTDCNDVRSILQNSINRLLSPERPYNTLGSDFIGRFGEFP